MPRPTPTLRIAPIQKDGGSSQEQELLEGTVASLRDANIFSTLVRAPGLFRRWLPFAGKLLSGKLPARDRELLILRTAWNCQAAYEWGHHVAIGLEAGLTPSEIERIPYRSPEGWDDPDATLLKA